MAADASSRRLEVRPGDGPEDAYAPLEMPDAWHVLSLGFFALALGARPLLRLLPFDLFPGLYRPIVPSTISLAAALVGALVALPGVFRGGRRGASRFALFLNLVVVGLTLVALAAFAWILRRR